MALTPSELSQYHEQGFIVKRQIVSSEVMARLLREVDGLHERMARVEAEGSVPKDVHISWEDLPGKKLIRQLMGSELVTPTIDAISRSGAVLDVMEQLIGPDVCLFHSKLMMKGAYDGTFTPWHQDWGYWKVAMREPSQVNAMLAIDRSCEANGALRFVVGTHKQGPVEHKRFNSTSFDIGLEGDINAFPSVMVELEPGDAVFFGPLVIHGSAANNSPMNRRANTFAYDKPGNMLQGDYPARNHRRGRVPAGV